MKIRAFSGYDPVVGWLALLRFIGALGFSLSIPFLTIYLHEVLGVPMTQIGLMMAIAGLAGAFGTTIGGMLSDRFGRRHLLIGILAARSLIFVVMAYLVWHNLSFHLFASVYILSVLMGTSIFPLTDSIIADVTPLDHRADAYSMLRVAANSGWAIGPALGGIIVTGGYYLMFLATSCALAVAVLIGFLKITETWKAPSEGDIHYKSTAILKDINIIRFLIVCLVMYLVKGQLIATMSVHASSNIGLAKTQIGWLYFLNGAMVVVLQVFVTKMIRRTAPLRALIGAGLLYGLGFLIVGYAGDMMTMIIAVGVITIAEMIEAPTASTYVSGLAPKGMTGIYMGSFNMTMHLGWSVGPLLGGILMDNMNNPQHVWVVIALVGCAAAGGFMVLDRIGKKNSSC